jgi:hypothetical protein
VTVFNIFLNFVNVMYLLIQCLANTLRTYHQSAQCVLLAWSGESGIINAWNEQYGVIIRALVNILTAVLANLIALCSESVLR